MVENMHIGLRNRFGQYKAVGGPGRVWEWERKINGRLFSFAVVKYKSGYCWAAVRDCETGEQVHEFDLV